MRNENLFKFKKLFIIKFLKIIFASITTGIFLKFLITIFETKLIYEYYFKAFYLILLVLICLSFYLILSWIIKAFKYEDIKLKY